MKKISFILNIVLVIMTLFFAFYANIQTKLAQEKMTMAETNAMLAAENAKRATSAAADAKEAESKALEIMVQLEICQNSK